MFSSTNTKPSRSKKRKKRASMGHVSLSSRWNSLPVSRPLHRTRHRVPEDGLVCGWELLCPTCFWTSAEPTRTGPGRSFTRQSVYSNGFGIVWVNPIDGRIAPESKRERERERYTAASQKASLKTLRRQSVVLKSNDRFHVLNFIDVPSKKVLKVRCVCVCVRAAGELGTL